jgi:hypothetical protein
MLSAAVAYSALLSNRRSRVGFEGRITDKVQLITSGLLLVAFFALGVLTGVKTAPEGDALILSDAICASPLASVEAQKNAGCEATN